MKQKIVKIWLGFALLMCMIIIIQSCCKPKNVKICGITFAINSYAYSPANLSNLNQNSQDGIDTSFGQFYFNLTGNTIFENDVCFKNVPFITSAYAFQPCENNLIDSIPRANISLSLNRDIVFNGQTVAAGADLLTNGITQSYIKYNSYNYGRNEGQLFIDSIDYPLLQIDTGLYTITTTTRTTSGHFAILSNKVLFKQ